MDERTGAQADAGSEWTSGRADEGRHVGRTCGQAGGQAHELADGWTRGRTGGELADGWTSRRTDGADGKGRISEG